MDTPGDADPTLSALPSVGVRIAAFAAICLSGLAGALIGYSLVSLQCEGDCAVWTGLGLLIGAQPVQRRLVRRCHRSSVLDWPAEGA